MIPPREKRISVRTLYRQMTKIAKAVAQGERFAVTKHGKAIFSIGPVQLRRGARYSLQDFQKLQWEGGQKDLSQRVDEVLYGE